MHLRRCFNLLLEVSSARVTNYNDSSAQLQPENRGGRESSVWRLRLVRYVAITAPGHKSFMPTTKVEPVGERVCGRVGKPSELGNTRTISPRKGTRMGCRCFDRNHPQSLLNSPRSNCYFLDKEATQRGAVTSCKPHLHNQATNILDCFARWLQPKTADLDELSCSALVRKVFRPEAMHRT